MNHNTGKTSTPDQEENAIIKTKMRESRSPWKCPDFTHRPAKTTAPKRCHSMEEMATATNCPLSQVSTTEDRCQKINGECSLVHVGKTSILLLSYGFPIEKRGKIKTTENNCTHLREGENSRSVHTTNDSLHCQRQQTPRKQTREMNVMNSNRD
jgi:hypothetical protein